MARGGEANGVAALEIARGQAVKGLDLDVGSVDRLRQVHNGAAEPAIELLGRWAGGRPGRSKNPAQSRPVMQEPLENHEVGEERHRGGTGVDPVSSR